MSKVVIPVRPGSQYTAEQIREAAAHYVMCGQQMRVSQLTGVPQATLSNWRTKSDWWPALVEEIRNEKQDELDAAYTRAIHKAIHAAIDRIEHGDPKLLKVRKIQDGEIVEDYEERRIPVSAKDAVMVSAIAFDKRQLLRGGPTAIGHDLSLVAVLQQIPARSAQMPAEHGERVIEAAPEPEQG